MNHAIVAVFSACLLAGSALAQSLSIASDPAALAAAALGDEPGSASVAVWRDGRLRVESLRRGVGSSALTPPLVVAAPDAQPMLYEIGSISKVFTGLLLAQAVEKGDLSLDDTLGGLLQGKLVLASADVAAITLKQLITHSSCLPTQFGAPRNGAAVAVQLRGADRAALWAALAAQELSGRGPCPASYSNYGIAVVGELLSDRYGKPWNVLVRDNITRPLGLADTLQHLGDKSARLEAAFAGANPAERWNMDAFSAAGGLRSSVQDLVAFGRALLRGRAGPFGAAAERLLTPLAAFQGGEIGYAIFISGPPSRRTYSHDGLTGGYRALLTMASDTGEVMVAMASNRQAPLPAMGLQVLASRYPVRRQVVAIEVEKLGAFAGVYRVDPELAFTLVAQDGRLYVRSSGSGFREYRPVAVDTFSRPERGAEIGFLRRGEEVVALRLEQTGRVIHAQRTTEAVPAQAVLVPNLARTFVGHYVAARPFQSSIEFDVAMEGGQLNVRSSAFPWAPVFPVAGRADRFSYEGVQAELQFERDANGATVAMVLHQNGELRALKAGVELQRGDSWH